MKRPLKKRLLESLPPHHPQHHRRGVTPVELLVVLAGLSLLSAIVLPTFSRTREKARQSACLNNARHLGVALLQYAQDNDLVLPQQNWVSGAHVNAQGQPCGGEWSGTPAHQLAPYLKTTAVWVCPSKMRGAPDPERTGFLSYGFNYLGYFPLESSVSPSLAAVTQPAQTVAIAEVGGGTRLGRNSDTSDAAWLDAYWQIHSYPVVAQSGPAGADNTNYRFQAQPGKHLGTVTVLYGDGHVKAVRPSQLTWGAFYGVFAKNTGPYGVAYRGDYQGPLWAHFGYAPAAWNKPVASPEMDAAEVKP